MNKKCSTCGKLKKILVCEKCMKEYIKHKEIEAKLREFEKNVKEEKDD